MNPRPWRKRRAGPDMPVNNAGYGLYGAVVGPFDLLFDLRRQAIPDNQYQITME